MNQREKYFNSVYMYRQIATSNEPGDTLGYEINDSFATFFGVEAREFESGIFPSTPCR